MDVETSTRGLDERGRFAPASDDLPLPLPPRPTAHGNLPVPRDDDGLSQEQPARLAWRTRGALGQMQRWVGAQPLRRLAQQAAEALALEIDRGIPFLMVPVFLACGAMVYFGLTAEPQLGVILVGVAAAYGGAAICRNRPAAFYACAALALVASGMALAKVETMRAGTRILGGEIATNVTGRVETVEHLANGRIRLTMAVTATERPTLRYVPQRIRVSARIIPDGLRSGSLVTGLVRLQPPPGPVRPGSYDFSFQSYFDGIGATGFFMSGPALASEDGAVTAIEAGRASVENLRMTIADRIRARIGGPQGQIAAALIVGVRAGIPEEVNEALRRAGLYHIISISGLHMALVAGVVMGGLRAALALFPGLAARRPVKKYAALAAILAIAAYLFISGGEVAAERSFIMLAVMLGATLFDRAALTTRNLAISAVVVIILAPHEVVGPSFQMSFAATAALVGAYGYWTNRARRDTTAPASPSLAGTLARRMLSVTAALAMTSLVAGLATAAFGIYHFQRVSPLSLFANLASMPVVSLVVMPCAVLASLAMPFGLDGPLLDVMGKGIAAMIAIAQWFSERSPVDAVGLIPGGSVICVTVALVIATMAATWLRLAALPFALAGLLMVPLARTPDILVAEDGTLVGLAALGDALAVNRDRPSAFAAQNWERAIGARSLLKPARSDKANGAARPGTVTIPAKLYSGDGAADPVPGEQAAKNDTGDGAFRCTAGTCVAVHSSGATVVHSGDSEAARHACLFARVIILADPAGRLSCADPGILVVSARQLAQSGSAAIFLASRGSDERPQIEFSITDASRPWHSHRQFSRAARGMAPWAPRKNPADKAPRLEEPAPLTQEGATRPLSTGE